MFDRLAQKAAPCSIMAHLLAPQLHSVVFGRYRIRVINYGNIWKVHETENKRATLIVSDF
jgi:hypothetical protein